MSNYNTNQPEGYPSPQSLAVETLTGVGAPPPDGLLHGADLKDAKRTLYYLSEKDPELFDSYLTEMEEIGPGIRTDFYKGGVEQFTQDVYEAYPQSFLDSAINVAGAFPDALASGLYAGSSEIRASASDIVPELEWDSIIKGMVGGLATIGASTYAGGLAGTALFPGYGTVAGLVGGFLGGTALAAGVGMGIGASQLDIGMDDWNAFTDVFIDTITNPADVGPERKTFTQIFPDAPATAMYLDVTALDPLMELVGFGVGGALFKGGKKAYKALTGKDSAKYLEDITKVGGDAEKTVADVARVSQLASNNPKILDPKAGEQVVMDFGEEAAILSFQKIAEQITPLIKQGKGITYNMDTGVMPDKGFSVAPFKDTELAFTAEELTVENVVKHLEQWKGFYEHEGMHFGAWFDDKSAKYMLDASLVVENELQAAAIGRSGGQLSIWDFLRKKADLTDDYWGTDMAELEAKYGEEQLAAAIKEWEESPLKSALQQTKEGILGGLQGQGGKIPPKGGVPPKVGENFNNLDNDFANRGVSSLADNAQIVTENLEGKGGKIMSEVVGPALRGEHEGQMAYDKAVYTKLSELGKLMTKAGIGNFYEPKNPFGRGALKVGRVFKRGGGNSLKRSKKVIGAIEANDFSTLTKDENNLATWLVTNLDNSIKDINRVREQYAKQMGVKGEFTPIVIPRENYFPHVFTVSFFDGLYGDLASMSDDSIKSLNAFMAQKGTGATLDIPEMTPNVLKIFQRELQPNQTYPGGMNWLGNLMPRAADEEGWSQNIMTAMQRYVEGTERITKMVMPAARAQTFFNELADKGKITSGIKEFYDDWIQEGLLGRLNAADQRLMRTRSFKFLNMLTGRMAGNLISGSSTFFINNLTAIPTLSSQGIGFGSIAKGMGKTLFKDFRPIMGQVVDDLPDKIILRNVKSAMRGLGFTANNFGMGHAMSKSKVLQNRIHTGYENLGRQALKSGSVSKLLIGIMNSGDQFAVANAFNSAYNAAIKSGLAEDAAVQFGDDIAMKTQAVYGRAYMSKLSRSKVFQTAVPFQTWTMQQFSWMRDNVLGKGTARLQFEALTPAQKLGTSMKFLGMAFAINSTYESLGLNAPWDLGSTIPAWDQLKMGLGGKPTRDANQMAIRSLWDITDGVASVYEHGFDINVPEIRKLVENGFLVLPRTGGLQAQRTLLGLFDLKRGYTTTSQGKNIYLEDYPDATTSFMEGLYATTFGPRRTKAYQEYKPEYERGPWGDASQTLFPSVNVPVPHVGPGEYKADLGFLNRLTEEK